VHKGKGGVKKKETEREGMKHPGRGESGGRGGDVQNREESGGLPVDGEGRMKSKEVQEGEVEMGKLGKNREPDGLLQTERVGEEYQEGKM